MISKDSFSFSTHRFGSSSSQASQNSGDICRICHCESDPQNPLLTPCYCSGSLKYVHQTCLQQWLTASETNSCELCKFPFIMHTKIKPFNEVSGFSKFPRDLHKRILMSLQEIQKFKLIISSFFLRVL